jgi:hypothetical protein
MKVHKNIACAIAVAAALAIPGLAMARGYHQYAQSYTRAYSARSPVHVRSYVRHDGRFVSPHVRTAPNHTKLDNWSTRGNVNPYTGGIGTKRP